MNQASKKINHSKEEIPIGPCGEHNCPVCVFTKSQAPGDPYDLKDCPKYNKIKGTQKQNIKFSKENHA